MHIQKIEIRNIRSVRNFTWEISDPDSLAGWHVLIGDNGSGKSTVLRSIALALVGEKNMAGLRQNWNDWLTQNQSEGSITLSLVRDEDYDDVSNRGRTTKNLQKNKPFPISLAFERDEKDYILINNRSKTKSEVDPFRYVWGTGSGW